MSVWSRLSALRLQSLLGMGSGLAQGTGSGDVHSQPRTYKVCGDFTDNGHHHGFPLVSQLILYKAPHLYRFYSEVFDVLQNHGSHQRIIYSKTELFS